MKFYIITFYFTALRNFQLSKSSEDALIKHKTGCEDISEFCSNWASLGFCNSNSNVKELYCPFTCKAECGKKAGLLLQNDDGCNINPSSIASQNNFVTGTNNFAWNLYVGIRRKIGFQKNVFFSPVSVSLALGPLLAGSRGETADQLRFAFVAPNVPSTETNGALQWLTNQMSNDGKNYKLQTVNGMFLDEEFTLKQSFLDIARCLQYMIEPMSFQKDIESVVTEINNFISNRTNDLITEVFSPDSINSDTKMILVNAIYFNGEWEKEFTEKNDGVTDEGIFFPSAPLFLPGIPAEGIQRANFMKMTSTFLYSDEDPDYKVLGIPYKNKEVVMFLLLPKEQLLETLELTFSSQNLQRMLKGTKEEKVSVMIPKFKITQDIALQSILESLGITNIFTDKADFYGISQEKMRVGAAIHKSVIEVNERGTKAAASTGFGMVLTSGLSEQDPPKKFFANHPFIFLLRHEESGVILFMGSISKIGDTSI